MNERSLKRLAVMVAAAIVIIVVLKQVGLRMAATVGAEHQKQVAARQASAPVPETPQTADPDGAPEPDTATDITAGSAPGASDMPDTTPVYPDAASEPSAPDDGPAAPDNATPSPDPTVSTPPPALRTD